MAEAWERSNHAHRSFLSTRQVGLRQLSDLIKMQITANQGNTLSSLKLAEPMSLFNRDDLLELAFGSMAKVFGAQFKIYEGRRFPRIPNGDLSLMSRVIAIEGERGQLNQPARIVSEYDVPENAWYFSRGHHHYLPNFVLMEAALQPCGFLSAYLGTALVYPRVDFYFRNLDGRAEILIQPEAGGKTLSVHANLLSTTVTAGLIIQKFTYSIFCQGRMIYHGESTFGYFPPEAIEKQAGLNGTRSITEEKMHDLTQLHQVDSHEKATNLLSHLNEKMQLIREVDWIKGGEEFGRDLVLGRKEINAQDWFYPCHFYQDPVMPGSLGVEAVLQSLALYAGQSGLLKNSVDYHFEPALNVPLVWKYRGQLTPVNKIMYLEIEVKIAKRNGSQFTLVGDAKMWADSTQIYEIKGAGINMVVEQ